MSCFTPLKVKRPAKLWALLTSSKSSTTATTTMTRIVIPRAAKTNSTMTSMCKTCKRWGPPCLFCVQSTPHPRSLIGQMKTGTVIGTEQESWRENKKKRGRDKSRRKRTITPQSLCMILPRKLKPCPNLLPK